MEFIRCSGMLFKVTLDHDPTVFTVFASSDLHHLVNGYSVTLFSKDEII